MNLIKSLILMPVLFCLAIPALPASADSGGVGFGSWVTFDEQVQNAIVAWNGEMEVLILSTEVSSAASGKLLEFLPLPSRPRSMTEGDYNCYWKIASYFDSNTIGWGSNGIESDDLYYYYNPNIQVLERVKVGPHDITVVKITSTEEFDSWVRSFASSRGLPAPQIPDRLQSCVGSYVGRSICYFAFDVIDIGQKVKRIEPVVYTFDTPFLFYPLEVTRDTLSNWWGHTISVFLVTGGKLKPNDGKWLSFGNLHGRSLNEKTPPRKLNWISEDVGGLFPEGAYLSYLMLTLESPADLVGLRDIGISFADFEDPFGLFWDLQMKKAGRYLSEALAPLSGPSVVTILPQVAPDDLAGQTGILIALMIFFVLALEGLLFRFFRWLGPKIDERRLLVESCALACTIVMFCLFVPYPILKPLIVIFAAIAFWNLVAAPFMKRVKIYRFRRLLKEMWKRPMI